MDYTVHGIFQARMLHSCSLLQGIFPTHGSNTGLPHCRQVLYQMSHKGSPKSSLLPCSRLQHQTSFGLQPSFIPGSCLLPLLSLIRLNVQACVCPLFPLALTLALSQLHLCVKFHPGLPLFPVPPYTTASTQTPTNPSAHLFLP